MSTEIKCPNCGEIIKLEEKDYLNIVSQVRTDEFNKDLKNREETLKRQFELEKLTLENKAKLEEEKLKASIKELNDSKIKELENKISSLESDNKNLELSFKLKMQEELDKQKEEISHLTNELSLEKTKSENALLNEKSKYDNMVKEKDELIDHYKDLKIKLSTKAIGEELEVYCKRIFESQLRPILSTVGNTIYFEKDNEAVEGTKGDFIYKETTKEGAEIISIMFEMKNEAESTESKHKNSDFFKKLDSDRKKKNCEYAVLVSLLEADNEDYNNGITTVYEYENMYVIRPNSFTALINLLRNNAIKNAAIKNELVLSQQKNIDITNFENKIIDFQESFSFNYEKAAKYYEEAIKRIDTTITSLEKIKEELTSSGNQLRLANNKAQDLTIKKLTYNNPTMKKMFDELKESK